MRYSESNLTCNDLKPGVHLMPNHTREGPFHYRNSNSGGDHGLSEWGVLRILTAQNSRFRKGWMKNQKCHCGSGIKFKKCCWNNYDKK